MSRGPYRRSVNTSTEPKYSFRVCIDTQEKKPWTFSSSIIEGIDFVHLKTGDYTIAGLENILCIGRKRSVTELAQNIHEERFFKELERMQAIPYRYILLESSLQHVIDYPMKEDLPPDVMNQIKIRGPYVLKCLNRIQVKYGVNIIYCETPYNAQWIATNIMKEVMALQHANETK